MKDRVFVLAVDVGQARDYTALIVLDSMHRRDAVANARPNERGRTYDVVDIERLRDVPYPDQVERIRQRYQQLEKIAEREQGEVRLVVDATGVGKPILDALRDEGVQPTGVVITGGDNASDSGGVKRVPKRQLVTTLQIAMQSGRLKIARRLPHARTLVEELQGFRVKIGASGRAKFGNDVGEWREAEHDDLVLAASLGVWLLERRRVTSAAYLAKASGFASTWRR